MQIVKLIATKYIIITLMLSDDCHIQHMEIKNA